MTAGRIFSWWPLFFVCMLLNGCATKSGGALSSSGGVDIVTESDEPENRKRARLRLELASGYFQQGQTNVALDELKQALVADSNFVDAHNLRGLVYMRLNDVPLAEESFRRALSISPKDADVAHNYGWLLCQQARYRESFQLFGQALANPTYSGQAKTLMTQGICQTKGGLNAEAEQSFLRAYELDAGNPVIAYNLTKTLFDRGDFTRAQFYSRRLNNSNLANAETLWIGIRIEQKLSNREAMFQLAEQLKKRYAQSREAGLYEKGTFNE